MRVCVRRCSCARQLGEGSDLKAMWDRGFGRVIIVTPEIRASGQTHADTALCVRVCLPLGHLLPMGVGLLPVCVLSSRSTCASASVAKTKQKTHKLNDTQENPK